MKQKPRPRSLLIWVPTNRVDESGRYTHMDGWNELLKGYKAGRHVGSALMRDNVQHVAMWARIAMTRNGWAPMGKGNAVPCKVSITFVERDRRRDVPNVHGGDKYALDALTSRHKYGASAIYDDSQRWLPEVEYHIAYASESSGFLEPGMRILIETLEDRK